MTLGRIYKVVSSTGVYVGSTYRTLETRLYFHKDAAYRYKLGKRTWYSCMDIIEGGDSVILLLEECEGTKDFLRERERFWIEKIDCVNKNRPIIKRGERKVIKNDRRGLLVNNEAKEYQRQWYQRNKERILQRAKEQRTNKTE